MTPKATASVVMVTRSMVRYRTSNLVVDVVAELIRLPSPVLAGAGSRVCGGSALSAPLRGAPLSCESSLPPVRRGRPDRQMLLVLLDVDGAMSIALLPVRLAAWPVTVSWCEPLGVLPI